MQASVDAVAFDYAEVDTLEISEALVIDAGATLHLKRTTEAGAGLAVNAHGKEAGAGLTVSADGAEPGAKLKRSTPYEQVVAFDRCPKRRLVTLEARPLSTPLIFSYGATTADVSVSHLTKAADGSYTAIVPGDFAGLVRVLWTTGKASRATKKQ
jgi:hypothetical protein